MKKNNYFCAIETKNTQMKSLHIITPVKDSIATTLDTIKAIMSSEITVPFTYTIYNDNSTAENTEILRKASEEYFKQNMTN